MMLVMMLTACRCVERGASQAKSYWRVIGGERGGGVPGLAEADGEVGAGGEEECEGAFGASVVSSWHRWSG
jgi:hypothetical protein